MKIPKIYSSVLVALLLPVSLAGCASYQVKTEAFRRDLRDHEPEKAAKALAKKAQKDGNDQVVYLFEYGTALQMAKDYKTSNKAFLKAEDLTEIKDYYSLSRISGSILLNEGMVQYKGEDYEKVLINAMLGINYLMMNNLDDALVEMRKLNEKLYKYRFEAKRNYEQNPFAFYLSAMIWEDSGNWDNAYIDYKRVYKLAPKIPYLREDLIRAAKYDGRSGDLHKWQKKFPHVKIPDLRKTGEVVLIYQQGWAPKKLPNPQFTRVPTLYPIFSETQKARLSVQGGPVESTEKIFSVDDIAVKTLRDKYAGLIAKRLAGIAAKAVVADQIRQKNKALGELAWIGMNLADRADLRQWSSLPSSFQVARVRLKPGHYKIKITGLNSADSPTGEGTDWIDVDVHAGKKTFLNWRSVR